MEIKSYQDLQVWQRSMDFVETIYKITQRFPKDEIYGLTSQLRRAAISIASNIAEGSAKRSTKEFIRFINISSSSVAEVQTQCMVSYRLKLIDKPLYEELMSQIDEIGRMLYGLHRALSERVKVKTDVVTHLTLTT